MQIGHAICHRGGACFLMGLALAGIVTTVAMLAAESAPSASDAVVASVPTQEEGREEALDVDDVCFDSTSATREDGSSSACGISLRQLRGEKAAALQPGPSGEPMPIDALAGMRMGGPDLGVQGGASQSGAPAYTPWDPSLAQSSSGELFTFYMYRTVSDEVYPPINVNAANLAGVLWYLHHEVVIQYPRKFQISRILRFKVQMRATQPLLNLGMNFGPRLAYDSGECTGPFVCGRKPTGSPEPEFCGGEFLHKYDASITDISGKPFNGSYEYERFGYSVGCNKLGEYPFPMFQVYYPDAAWYSLPGACPSRTWKEHSSECKAAEPGGFCKGEPTGAGNCTWTYEYMGEIYLDELVGDINELHAHGGREYDPVTDKGVQTSFWNGINSTKANMRRIHAAQKAFGQKYPNQTLDEDMPPPPCDFNFGQFYRPFYWKDPFSGKCVDAKPGSHCYSVVKWGMTDGIFRHPEWFPGLTTKSGFKDFQRLLFAQGKVACPYRPCENSGDSQDGSVAPMES